MPASVRESATRFSTWFWQASKWARYGIAFALFLVLTFLIAILVGLVTNDLIGKLAYFVWAGPISSALFSFGFLAPPKQDPGRRG